MSLYPQGDKYNDAELAAKLWPVYLQHGTVEAVYRHCQKTGEKISVPTLHKMADHFGWQQKRNDAAKASFSGAIDQTGELESMLADLVGLKGDIQAALKKSSLDVKLHGIYGSYIGQILALRKLMLDEKKVDRDRLLIDALKAVVNWLMENGFAGAARRVADNLETIEGKIRDQWD